MKLSVVATLYRSAPYVAEFHRRCSAAARQAVGDNYEIVLVNDGSPDNSLPLAVALTDGDPRVVVVDLSRNFGHHKAIMTGLAHARGERVFLLDSDLEESPEWLASFTEQLERERCDVVYGVQAVRKGDRVEQLTGEWFYRMVNLVTGTSMPRNVVTARLMTRRYVDALLQYREREVFLAGLWYSCGFEQHPQTVTKLSRSPTTYTWRRKFEILVNSLTSFSNAPLVGIFYVGLVISLLALLYIAYLVIYRLFLARPLDGWTSIMASVWLLGGLIISFIGVVGIYLAKVFSETKQRPYTIVREVYGRHQ